MLSELTDFIVSLTEKGVRFKVEENRLLCDAPSGVIDNAIAEKIKSNKPEIISILSEENEAIKAVDESSLTKRIPMTQSQERLLFLDHLMDGVFAGNLPVPLKLYGDLNVPAFQNSLQAIVDRHSILRTTFHIDGERLYQKIHSKFHVDLVLMDYRSEENIPYDTLDEFIVEEGQKPFDLAKLPLFKFFLIKIKPGETIFFFVKPSIIWDGWSFDVFIHELDQLYDAFRQGNPSSLQELKIQFYDYSIWHRKRITGYEVKKQIEFWKKKLPGHLPKMVLPFDRKRPNHFIYKGEREFIHIPWEDVKSLKTFCKEVNLTLFIAFLAVFKILLYRYTNAKEILLSLPMWNRVRPETEDLIGHFVNNILLLTSIDPKSTFRETLFDVQANFVDAFNNQEAPFEKILEELNLVQTRGRDPIYQVYFSYQDARNRGNKIGDLDFEQLGSHLSFINNDLSFWLKESEDKIIGAIDYSTDLFDRETIRRFQVHYTNLLKSCLDDPDKEIFRLEMLTEKDVDMVHHWSKAHDVWPAGHSILDRFKKRATDDPDQIAVTEGNRNVSYGELDLCMGRVAKALHENGIKGNLCVGILTDQSIGSVELALGILKSGNGFVFIDPNEPAHWMNRKLESLKPDLFLTHSTYARVAEKTGIKYVVMDDNNDFTETMDFYPRINGSSAAVYFITTMSDGTLAKGHLTHEVVLSMADGIHDLIKASHEDIYYCDHDFSQGDGVLSCILPFVWGCKLVIGEKKGANEPVSSVFDRWHPTIIHSCFENMRLISTKGEITQTKIVYSGNKCPDYVEKDVLKKCGGLWYFFGYPETAFWNGYQDISGDGNRTKRINGTLGNACFQILDSMGQPMPVGAEGKLFVGGLDTDCVAETGSRDENTNDGKRNDRLFDTGDKAKLLSDGTLEIIESPMDFWRNFSDRVLMKEIEDCMCMHPAVSAAAVLAIQDHLGPKMIGFYAAEQGENLIPNDMVRFLTDKLPETLRPITFVSLESLPVLENCRVDKESLAYHFWQSTMREEDIVEPETETEKKLTKIWEKLLNIDHIGTNQVFFDLGGHSLLAVGLFARINETFGIDLPLATLFKNPTIKGIAYRIDAECYINHKTSGNNLSSSDSEEFEI